MKFAIISDTHDNLSNIKKALEFLHQEQIEVILHCGDISNQDTIDEMEKLFHGKIHFVRGNADYSLDQIPEKREIELGGKKIFFNHYPEIARQAAETRKYDLVFYGHTHKPCLDRHSFSDGGAEKECLLVNPGELAGQRYKPCFAIFDTKTNRLELKILEKL